MKRSQIALIISLSVSAIIIGFGGLYLYKYLRRWVIGNIEREQVTAVQRDLATFKSLGFMPDCALCRNLEQYGLQLEERIALRDSWMSVALPEKLANIDQLIAVNKKMLKSYIRDLQEYRRMGIATTNNLVRFSYDKVVRLTLALAELEKNKLEGISPGEYTKKVQRMREITLQSIAHSKNSLRNQLGHSLGKTNESIVSDRKHLTNKVEDLIALNKVLFL